MEQQLDGFDQAMRLLDLINNKDEYKKLLSALDKKVGEAKSLHKDTLDGETGKKLLSDAQAMMGQATEKMEAAENYIAVTDANCKRQIDEAEEEKKERLAAAKKKEAALKDREAALAQRESEIALVSKRAEKALLDAEAQAEKNRKIADELASEKARLQAASKALKEVV